MMPWVETVDQSEAVFLNRQTIRGVSLTGHVSGIAQCNNMRLTTSSYQLIYTITAAPGIMSSNNESKCNKSSVNSPLRIWIALIGTRPGRMEHSLDM